MKLLLLAAAAWAGFVQEPRLRGVPPPGRELASAALPPLLDRQRDLVRYKDWAVGVASTADLSAFYLTFEKPGSLLIVPVDKPAVLVKEGLNVEVAPDEFCLVKVAVGLLDLFNPLRCATLKVNGAEFSTGKLLDELEKKSLSFKNGRREYWVLYATDVDAETDKLADTRTLLIVRENGLGTKVWPVPETELGGGVLADLGEARLGLTLSGGRLVVTAPR